MTALKTSTTRQLNNLIEFRQTVYDQILTKASDPQFELVDALLLSEQVGCFAELSLSPVFQRRWPSAYRAIEDGEQSSHWLSHCFGRPFGRLINASLDAIRHQRRISSPWRFNVPSHVELVSFQGT